jgi:UDP-glucose 4-epimerase
MMKCCLVTGATGLLGSRLISYLSRAYHLIGVSSQEQESRPEIAEWIVADLSDSGFAKHLPSRIDRIVHLAQSPHFRDFPGRSLHIAGVNTWSTVELLDYARKSGASSFLYASSGGVYAPSNQPLSEECSPQPKGFYPATKLASELLCRAYADHFAVEIIRPFFMYGPGQESHMLLPRLVRSIMDGKPIRLQGQEGLRLNPIDADDAARLVAKAIELRGCQTINLAGLERVSLRELCLLIGEILECKVCFEEAERGGGEIDLIGETSQMERLLGSPTISLREGLTRLINSILPALCR